MSGSIRCVHCTDLEDVVRAEATVACEVSGSRTHDSIPPSTEWTGFGPVDVGSLILLRDRHVVGCGGFVGPCHWQRLSWRHMNERFRSELAHRCHHRTADAKPPVPGLYLSGVGDHPRTFEVSADRTELLYSDSRPPVAGGAASELSD